MALPNPNSQNIAIIMYMIISGASARPDVGVLWQNWNENQFSKRLQVKISLGEAKLAKPVLKPINLYSGGNSKNRDFPKNISILPQLTWVRTMLGTGSRTEEGSHLDYLKVYRHIAKNRIVKSEMKKSQYSSLRCLRDLIPAHKDEIPTLYHLRHHRCPNFPRNFKMLFKRSWTFQLGFFCH